MHENVAIMYKSMYNVSNLSYAASTKAIKRQPKKAIKRPVTCGTFQLRTIQIINIIILFIARITSNRLEHKCSNI